MVEGARLESVYTATYRGFEPLSLRQSIFGVLAQLVEQWTLNPSVRGSSPRHPTNKFNRLACSVIWKIAIWLQRWLQLIIFLLVLQRQA